MSVMQTRDVMVVTIFFCMVTLIHVYLGWRLMAIVPTTPGRTLLGLTLAFSVIIIFFCFSLRRTAPAVSFWLLVIEWSGYLLLGFILLLFPFLVFRDALTVVTWLGTTFGRLFVDHDVLTNPSRRLFLQQASGFLALGSAGSLSVAGFVSARRVPKVEHVPIPIKNLAAELEGFRIVQLSDVHIGPTIKRSFLETVVEKCNALKGDIVVITGDLVDGFPYQLHEELLSLTKLQSKYGNYYVTGNHEYYWGAEGWIREVSHLGLIPLINEHKVIEIGDKKVVVAGVTDIHAHMIIPSHRSDPKRSIKGSPRADVKVLLAHQPRTAFFAKDLGFDLQLSGHTHGGQFFPWTFVIRLIQPVVRGLRKIGSMWVYVSCGTGYWGPPLRLGAPSEITLLTLHREGSLRPNAE